LWWFGRPFDKKTRLPSFVHDYLYNETTIPRLIADLIFLDMMKDNGVGFFKRWAYFKVVILFGWVARIK
jgi:hypothetical protein